MQNPRLKGGFGQCSSNVMRDPSVSMRDKVVYAYMCVFADKQSNSLHVTVKTMAAELDVTPITIMRSLKQLEKQNVIKRVARGRGQSTITMLLK